MGKVAKSFVSSKSYHRKSSRLPKFGKAINVNGNGNENGIGNGEIKEFSADIMDEDISETSSPATSDMDEDSSDGEDDSDFDSDEVSEAKQMPPRRPAIYDRDGLMDKLGDISWPEEADWTDRLSVDVDREVDPDVNDDLARELAFYTQALNGTRQAFEKLQSLGLPFLRPTDYYAEMVKSDAHMEKVKGRLLSEKKRIEEMEERQKARQAKRIAKEVQANKMKERTRQKKDDIEAVKTWRKQRKQSGYPDVAERELPFDEGLQKKGRVRPGVSPWDRSGGKKELKNKKGREARNSKYGFGGRKGMKKQNTAESTYADKGGFNEGEGKRRKDDGWGKGKHHRGFRPSEGGKRKMDDVRGKRNQHGNFKKNTGKKSRKE